MFAYSFLRRWLLIILSLIAVSEGQLSAMDLACAPTPELAAKVSQLAAVTVNQTQRDGYRIIAIRRDPLLHQSWAMVANCDHPEWPTLAVPVSGLQQTPLSGASQQQKQVPFTIVHAGDLVQLWRQEEDLRIEVAGRAEENGVLGSRIRVRLVRSGFDVGKEETWIGVVRGPTEVEITR